MRGCAGAADTSAIHELARRAHRTGSPNELFSDTPRAAHASAAINSLVETAKANGLEPYHYFRYLFMHLPAASSNEDLAKLLPLNLSKRQAGVVKTPSLGSSAHRNSTLPA